MTSSNNLRVSIVEETTHGTTPATPAMLTLEANSQSFAPTAPKADSDIIRTDHRLKSRVPLNRSANGGITADLVYPTVNQGLWAAIRAALNAAENAQVTNADACTITTGGTTVTRTLGSFVTDGFAVGDIAKISNATAAADNRYGLVTAVAALTLTLQLPDAATWVTTDASVTVTRAARMKDNTATTERAFSFEVAWLDLQKMFVATGQVFDTLEIAFAMGQKTTVRLGTVGRDLAGSNMASATVGIAGATYTAPTELPVFGPARAIYVVIDGNSYPVQSLAIATARGAQVGHSTAGGATPDRVVPGTFQCTLRGQAYFAVVSLITACTAGSEVPVWVVMEDGAGKALSFSLGTVTFDTAPVPPSGRGQIEMVAFGAAAANNATRDAVLTFQRWE